MSEKTNLPRIFSYMAILCVLFIGQISCSEQGVNTTSEKEIDSSESLISEDVKDVILSLGFNPEGAKEIGDYFVVEDDIAISKGIVEEGIRSCTDIRARAKSGDVSVGDSVQVVAEKMKQWAANSTVVGINKVSNMTYKIDSSIPNNKHGAIHDAVNMWNNVSGSRLELEANSSADITFYRYDSAPSGYSCLNFNPNNQAGRALFPENGNPGAAITLDPYTNDEALRTHAVHELGHAFGFRHSNWQGSESQSGTSFCGQVFNATRITGTPQNDANSVMQTGTLPTSLGVYDKISLKVMYPTSLTPPQIVDLEPECTIFGEGEFVEGSITIKYPTSIAQKVVIEVKEGNASWQEVNLSGYTDNSQIVHRWYWFDSMSNFNFPKGFRTKSLNFSGDYVSNYSTPVYIQENELNCDIE